MLTRTPHNTYIFCTRKNDLSAAVDHQPAYWIFSAQKTNFNLAYKIFTISKLQMEKKACREHDFRCQFVEQYITQAVLSVQSTPVPAATTVFSNCVLHGTWRLNSSSSWGTNKKNIIAWHSYTQRARRAFHDTSVCARAHAALMR